MLIASFSTATINARSRTFWVFLLWTKHILITDKSNKNRKLHFAKYIYIFESRILGFVSVGLFFLPFSNVFIFKFKNLYRPFLAILLQSEMCSVYYWLFMAVSSYLHAGVLQKWDHRGWFTRVISPKRTFVSDFDKNAPRSLRGAIILTNSWLWKKGLQSTDIFFNLLKAKPEKKRQII